VSEGGSNLVLALGIGLVLYAVWGAASGADAAVSGDGGDEDNATSDDGDEIMQPSDIASLAQSTLGQMDITDIAPQMVATIAMIESSGDPGAVRQEPAINDASYGLCQVLLGTASWLADSMGYSALGEPTAETLLDPATNLYFACAYMHWLRNYKGAVQSDAFVVGAYNGGPGNPTGPGPTRYLASYEAMASNLGFA
jgi:soluble lytic murein transglycosylase-like protein